MKIGNGKSIKELMQVVSGILLIALVFVLNGFLSFVTVGFDFGKLATSSYWANFFILFASEMAVMFGVYIIQKLKDLKNKKITDLQEEIQSKRNVVYGVDKVAQAEDWLREIYNYKEKLLIFERSIKSKYERLKLIEPKQTDKFYEHKKKVYEKNLEKKEFLTKQMEYIRIAKTRLQLVIKGGSQEEIDKLEKQIDTNDFAFRTAKIHYTEVYWGDLLSDIEANKYKENSPFFSEKKELSKNVAQYFGMGLILSALLSALIVPSFTAIGWQTIISMITSLITLILFMVRGIGLSKKIILGRYYKSLEQRKSIYNKMLKDLGISKIVIEGEDEQE